MSPRSDYSTQSREEDKNFSLSLPDLKWQEKNSCKNGSWIVTLINFVLGRHRLLILSLSEIVVFSFVTVFCVIYHKDENHKMRISICLILCTTWLCNQWEYSLWFLPLKGGWLTRVVRLASSTSQLARSLRHVVTSSILLIQLCQLSEEFVLIRSPSI